MIFSAQTSWQAAPHLVSKVSKSLLRATVDSRPDNGGCQAGAILVAHHWSRTLRFQRQWAFCLFRLLCWITAAPIKTRLIWCGRNNNSSKSGWLDPCVGRIEKRRSILPIYDSTKFWSSKKPNEGLDWWLYPTCKTETKFLNKLEIFSKYVTNTTYNYQRKDVLSTREAWSGA